MRARDIIEAILRPDPRALDAFDRAGQLPPAERDALLQQNLIDIDQEGGASAKSNLRVTVGGVGKDYRDELAHELIHREQFRQAGSQAKMAHRHYARTTSKHGEMFEKPGTYSVNDKAMRAYFGHPYEIMAYAHDLAQDMKRKYGSQALRWARSGGWEWTDAGRLLRPYFDPKKPEGKRLLKYLFAYLNEAESPKRALAAVTKRGPHDVGLDDVDIEWVRPGNQDYPPHWTAMWKTRFIVRHQEIVGCPLGSSDLPGRQGGYHALNDLVNRTNRESKTNFVIRIPETT
jgi:hypothetical protein